METPRSPENTVNTSRSTDAFSVKRAVARRKRALTAGSSAIGSRVSSFIDDVSTLLEPTKHHDADHPIRTVAIVFNLLQTSMGVGILSLATTYEDTGIIVGSVMFILLAMCSHYSIKLLLRAVLSVQHGCTSDSDGGQYSLESLGETCFGFKGRLWVQTSLVGMCLVALVAFLVPLKAFLYTTLKALLSSSQMDWFKDHGGRAETLLVVVLVLVIIPLSLLRKIDKLWVTSLLGVFFVIYFVVISIVLMGYYLHKGTDDLHCYELHGNNQPSGKAHLARWNIVDFLQAISIGCTSFLCQMTVFPVFREVRIADGDEGARAKMERASAWAMTVVTCMYIGAASSGYILWRDLSSKPSSILACYDPTSIPITFVYIGMSCTLMFAFPLVLFSARYSIMSILSASEEQHTFQKHALVTMAIIVPCAGVAVCVNQLSIVLSIGGAFAAPPLVFLIPASCYLKAQALERKKAELLLNGAESDDCTDFEGGVEDGCGQRIQRSYRLANASSTGAWCLLVVGAFAQVACIIGSILAAI